MAKILVVDDSSAVRETLKCFLLSKGYAVFLAENGSQGLSVVAAEKPDLIITDLNMPVLNGLELVKGLRGIGVNTPTIVRALNPTLAVRETVLAAGVDDCLDKNSGLEVLLARVTALLAKGSQAV